MILLYLSCLKVRFSLDSYCENPSFVERSSQRGKADRGDSVSQVNPYPGRGAMPMRGSKDVV